MNISAFLIGFCSAFFLIFAVFFLSRKSRTRFQTVLGGIMVVWALWCFKDIIITFPGMYNEQVLNWITIIDGWSALTYMVFLFEVVMPGWMTTRRIILQTIPFAIFTIAYILWPQQEVIIAYWVFLWFYAWFIVFFGYFKGKKYVIFMRKNYSNIDKMDISWLKTSFFFTIVSQLSWLFTSIYASSLVDIIYYLSCIIMWVVVLYYSWDFHPITIEKESPNDLISQNSNTPPLPIGKLEKVIEERKLYLNPNLTVIDLANELNTNRTYVSNYLSQYVGRTFYEYINSLRIIKMSIPLIEQHPEFTFEYVATESGFASISTFRRAFIKEMGMTPSQYASKCKGTT